jgi:ATP-dependent RNA helicase DHX8/PRP22
MYLKEPESDFIEAALMSCLQIYEEEEDGGVLVFLPGQEDIESLQQLLLDHLPLCAPHRKPVHSKNTINTNTISAGGVVEYMEQDMATSYSVRVLYAAMPSEEQLAVFEPAPPGMRLFILATNIAETSLTISGVKYGQSALRLVRTDWLTRLDLL